MVLIYVNDMVIIGNDDMDIQDLKLFLHKQFHINDLENLKYFLDIEVTRSKAEIAISQQKYTLQILNDVGLLGAKLLIFLWSKI